MSPRNDSPGALDVPPFASAPSAAGSTMESLVFVDRREEAFVERFLDALRPWLVRFFDPEVRGLERYPAGPALLVANHSAGLLMPDVFVLADALARRYGVGALPYALAHDVLFSFRTIRAPLEQLGAVRASPSSARALFASGRKVLVYPGGDRDALRPYRDRHRIVFGDRRGYVRMALREGVPIVPVVVAGAHEVFMVLDDGARLAARLGLPRRLRVNVVPTVLSLPWGLTVGFPPPYLPVPTRIVAEILEPVAFAHVGEDAAQDDDYVEACHCRVVAAMQARLDRIVAADEVGVRARFRRAWPDADAVGRILEAIAAEIDARSPFRSHTAGLD